MVWTFGIVIHSPLVESSRHWPKEPSSFFLPYVHSGEKDRENDREKHVKNDFQCKTRQGKKSIFKETQKKHLSLQ